MRQKKVGMTVLAVGAGLLLSIVVAGCWAGLRLNLTPSFPLGIWRIEPLNRAATIGDRVFICPPDVPAFTLGMERGYLPPGLCPAGSGPLIKTIVAREGQDISIDTAVIIDGAPLPGSELRSADAQGRPLPKFPGGQVPAGSVFLHSDFGGSYDSRYFGPLPSDGILGLAHPVLVFW